MSILVRAHEEAARLQAMSLEEEIAARQERECQETERQERVRCIIERTLGAKAVREVLSDREYWVVEDVVALHRTERERSIDPYASEWERVYVLGVHRGEPVETPSGSYTVSTVDAYPVSSITELGAVLLGPGKDLFWEMEGVLAVLAAGAFPECQEFVKGRWKARSYRA